MSVSPREVRPPPPPRSPLEPRLYFAQAASRPCRIAGAERSGAGRQLAGWRAVGGGVHARQRFLVQRPSCACGWSARGGAERSRRGGAPAGRGPGPEPGRAGPGRGRGRNAPVLLRAVGLAVGCPQRPLLRPVRGSQLQRAGAGEGRLRRGRALERRAGGEGG